MDNNIIEFPVIGDERGNLVSLEQMKSIPFEMKRVYYMYDLQKDLARGFHAHKDLQQVLVCLKGSCKVLLDDGRKKEIHYLDQPNKGLLIDKMVWHEMYNFSNDCVLMVIASGYYDEEDYIRNYQDFINIEISIKFCEYEEIFLDLSRVWLRDQEIKELTMTPDFDDEGQKKWYKSLKNKEDYYIRGIKYKEKPIGVVGIKNINSDSAEYWGYIGEKDYWGMGLGKYLLDYCYRYAQSIGLSFLYLKVAIGNDRAIKLYKKMGFKVQSNDEEVLTMVKWLEKI